MEVELQGTAQLMFRLSEGNIAAIEANYYINSLVSLKNNIIVVCNELVPVKTVNTERVLRTGVLLNSSYKPIIKMVIIYSKFALYTGIGCL